jgi:hypothetical protein
MENDGRRNAKTKRSMAKTINYLLGLSKTASHILRKKIMGYLVNVCLLSKTEKCTYQKVRVIAKKGKTPKEVITCRMDGNCNCKKVVDCQEVEKCLSLIGRV